MEPKVVGCPVFYKMKIFFGDHSSSSMFDLGKSATKDIVVGIM